MDNLGERLKKVLDDKGLTQADLAEMIDTTQMAVSHIIANKTKKPRNLLEIANALGVDPNWLRTGNSTNIINSTVKNSPISSNQNNFFDAHGGNKPTTELQNNTAENLSVLALNYERLAKLAGVEVLNKHFEQYFDALHFSEEGVIALLRQRSADNIVVMSMFNDSMQPLINKKDLLFIDVNCKQYAGEGIYLFILNSELYIRRLLQTPEGMLRAVAENERTGLSFDISEENKARLKVIGRCIRKMPINVQEL
ncbi:XRE family transcriptional regulator [Avibacterium paragallinarum]|uniref:Helix-turn-helix domain-containing protein n=1 Tax=Avibacterium paragallinarum TaxID=728 RepID=A0A8B3TEF1_AVIPA|nr:helix-turn-helix domain-containing protein [Avibacterium paragallinarum]RZN53053.1 helix-turn-helix domain-containing protein [Avibacterium paragallinarum]RZN53567.1 helix-turn-helix domain-containing protein [Avibacterium paragallinarum]TID11745.1 XRE family transcriptional regulator [Avibacterium paragallinarum]